MRVQPFVAITGTTLRINLETSPACAPIVFSPLLFSTSTRLVKAPIESITTGINAFPLSTPWTAPTDGFYWLAIAQYNGSSKQMYGSSIAVGAYAANSTGTPTNPFGSSTVVSGGNNAHLWATSTN